MADSRVRTVVRVGLMVAVTTVGAWISIPLTGSVPFSLQTSGVIGSGLILGPAGGTMSQLAYLGLGAVGVPVFAGFRAGAGVLLGPTGGFLVGFIPAAAITGLVAQRRNPRSLTGAVVAGLTAVYACGMGGLMLWTGLDAGPAAMAGVVPFVIPDLILCAVTVVVVQRLERAGVGVAWSGAP